jgi:hypothetical protein
MSEIASDEVLLQADPTNEHDPNAIKVLVFSDPVMFHIGFIPKEVASKIDRSMLPSKGRIIWRSTDEKGVGVRIFV